MAVPISQLVPNPADLLSLEPEDLAGVLLEHLHSYRPGDSSISQNGRISLQQFLAQPAMWRPGYKPQSSQLDDIDQAVTEAWAWLQSEAFLIRDPTQPAEWYKFSRRAQRLKSRTDLDSYRKANLLPRGQLHPLIAAAVYPAFLGGKYDLAIFAAFREVEVAVRQAGSFLPDLVGVPLMRAAFATANSKNNQSAGPLTDTQLPVGEQEATAHLFAGAFGVYRNSTGHRHVPTEAVEAAEVIMFASQLLRIVDRLKPQPAGGKP